jgi:hypothetical protein
MKKSKDLYKETFSEISASQELKIMLKNIPKESHKNNKKPIRKLTAILVAAIIIAVSCVSVYAGVNIYNFYTEQNGKYSQKLVIDKTEKESDNSLKLSKEETVTHPKFLMAKFNYMPKGYDTYSSPNSISKSNDDIAGVSLNLYDVSDTDVVTCDNNNILNSELTTIEGNDMLYIQKSITEDYDENNPVYDKSFFMYLKDYDYLLCGDVTTDISKKELYKILENLSFVEMTEKDYDKCLHLNSFSMFQYEYNGITGDDIQVDESNNCYVIDGYSGFNNGKNKFYEVGEKFSMIADDEKSSTINATVDKVEVLDDLSVLPDSYKDKYTDKNGKINPLVVKCYGDGDGVNSLSKLVATKEFPMKLVYETLTLENPNSYDLKNITITSDTNTVDRTDFSTVLSLENQYDSISYDTSTDYYGFIYDDFNYENKPSNNNFYDSITVPANSKVTVHLAYLVLADDLNTNPCIIMRQLYGNYQNTNQIIIPFK